MNYDEAITYLNNLVDYERLTVDYAGRADFSLEIVNQTAALLGDPQKKYPCIHVAGTKGKGSTCAFISSLLQAAGFKTGLYISPHLVDPLERIQINDRNISPDNFAEVITKIQPELESSNARGDSNRPPTYYETFTYAAFQYFADAKVDFAVFETGLGGRLDATNIITPLVCGITPIALEHTRYLGDTHAKIAAEKAGIIKKKVPVFSAQQVPEAMTVIQEKANTENAPLKVIGEDIPFKSLPSDSTTTQSGEIFLDDRPIQTEIGLLGKHQVVNWALAVAIAKTALEQGQQSPITPSVIQTGSKNVHWPGRLELIDKSTIQDSDVTSSWEDGLPVFIDGAHTIESLQFVLSELKKRFPERKWTIVFGCAGDKDIRSLVQEFGKHTGKIIFTTTGNPRSTDPETLATEWNAVRDTKASVQTNPKEAFTTALNLTEPTEGILVTGSLYLVGIIKELQT